MSTLEIERLEHADGLDLPSYETAGSAGLDLRAAVAESLVLEPGARTLVPTGLKLAIPLGYEGQVRPRSGLALKHGLTVLRGTGGGNSARLSEFCRFLGFYFGKNNES